MRLATVSLIAAAGFAASAFAQTPQAAPATAVAAPAAPAATPPPTAAPETPPAPPAPPPPPPPPPPAPTDPTAIALLNALQSVCIPAANGSSMADAAKASGYRKNGDNFVLKTKVYQLTILAQGSNPNQCHVDVVHPIDPEGPAAPVIIALHNWAAVSRGWDLYRNDKNNATGQELTTRSWEHTANGTSEALVLTTFRKADGAPMQKAADTSTMFYSVDKTQ